MIVWVPQTYRGRVPVRASGSFNILTPRGVIQSFKASVGATANCFPTTTDTGMRGFDPHLIPPPAEDEGFLRYRYESD